MTARARLDFHRLAVAQIREALAWWADHRDKAPTRLRDELREALALLRDTPAAGTPCRTQRPGVRRLVLRRSRYVIFYAVAGDSVVEVLRLWHANRGTPPAL